MSSNDFDPTTLPAVHPLLTYELNEALQRAARLEPTRIECSLDLERSRTVVTVDGDFWTWKDHRYPFIERCKPRTIYYWSGTEFLPVARYSNALIKLVPTQWGAPTFEIDGIKMLPTSQQSPITDAEQKVALIEPSGKHILDTCGGLGYFAVACLQGAAQRVTSLEKNADVLWLRSLNPWSPELRLARDARLDVQHGDVIERIATFDAQRFDAVLHDPPRFGIAGELYSQAFYDQLARVIKRRGALFHYTGTPNKLTSGRDVPNEVATRLRRAGFKTQLKLDGVYAVKAAS